ncbi:unnamed protein product [Closterium sp. NIES-64]|nr:unnamed protein product [Closterium sp. NIES-64]
MTCPQTKSGSGGGGSGELRGGQGGAATPSAGGFHGGAYRGRGGQGGKVGKVGSKEQQGAWVGGAADEEVELPEERVVRIPACHRIVIRCSDGTRL